MPELPEVETIKNDLRLKIVGLKFSKITVNKPKIIKGLSAPSFKRRILNRKIIDLNRRGKLLIFSLSSLPEKSNEFLLIHLKMTGQLIYSKKDKIIPGGHSNQTEDLSSLPNKHTHIIFEFSDQGRLFFNDLRQFGYLKIVRENELAKIISQFGPEPLNKEFNAKTLASALKNKKAPLKSILLNQKLIAGLGNIYVDESCFLARLNPLRSASSLSESEIKKLALAIKSILKKAVKHRGTTFNNYRDSEGKSGNFLKFLKVYRRHNSPCPVCLQPLQKTKLSSRGTHFCPFCQK